MTDREWTQWTPEDLRADLESGQAEIIREPSRAKGVISIRIDGELERRVWQIATRRGIRPTALMRQYIEAGVAADVEKPDVVALLSHAQADIARAQQLASEQPGREAA